MQGRIAYAQRHPHKQVDAFGRMRYAPTLTTDYFFNLNIYTKR